MIKEEMALLVETMEESTTVSSIKNKLKYICLYTQKDDIVAYVTVLLFNVEYITICYHNILTTVVHVKI